MVIAWKNIYIAQPGIVNTTLYTCPENVEARIAKCTITNDTTTVQTISFNKVPSGEAVGDENLIMNERAIGPKETFDAFEIEGQILNAGYLINAIASVASQLTVNLDVIEST